MSVPCVVIRHQGAALLFTLATIAGTAWGSSLSESFHPTEDTGQISILTEERWTRRSSRWWNTNKPWRRCCWPIRRWKLSPPRLARATVALVTGRFNVKLKPRKERGSAQEAVQQLRVQLARIPGMRSFPPQVPPVIRIGGTSSNSPYQLTLASVSGGALPSRATSRGKIRAVPEHHGRQHGSAA